MKLKLETQAKSWPMREPFAISRGVQTEQPTLHVHLTDETGLRGRGEACGVSYHDETPETMVAQIEAVRVRIEAGLTRQELLSVLPAGGARFAVDSALWDLEAKRSGRSAFDLAGVPANPVSVDFTIGIRDIASYEATARRYANFAVLKIKVDHHDPLAALRAVRRGAPDPRLIVDPNQSWSVDLLKSLGAELQALGVALLEQPIPIGDEAGLDGYTPPVPLCADELIDDVDDLQRAIGRFQFVNIKLDKSGGLTAALALADRAEALGFGLMVGCMAGSSLAMAPAMVLAQRCAFADLDGPLLQAEDIEHGLVYENGVVARPHDPRLWG